MKIPKPDADAIRRFERLVPRAPGITVRKVFGQPAAFVSGNMFLGVFGSSVFVRLDETRRAEALKVAGAAVFEPMPGRAMREYVTLPSPILESGREAERWAGYAYEYARSLPAKKPSVSKTAR